MQPSDVSPSALEAFTVRVHEAEEGGYWGEVLELPGCASQGETLDELKDNIVEAIEACLQVYLEDGDLGIDNNVSERGFRGIALGRRNWLFLGANEAGETAAVLYSIVASCRQNGVEPFSYLREVLRELPKLGRKPKDEELAAWLPEQWKQRQQAARSPPGEEGVLGNDKSEEATRTPGL